ncbi:MAG: ABC-type transport auxiliary lipoprotein family protein [Alphaproteobacteria bacterium]
MNGATGIGRRRALGLFGTAGLWAAGGCTLPGDSPPPQLYTLSPKSTFAPDLPLITAQMIVDEPFAAAGLDTARIALAQDAYRLEYFAESAWSDRAPSMVQTLIVESFENSGRIVAIARESTDLRPDFILKTELREFQAQLHGENEPPSVWVQINAKLVKMPERLIFANNTFEASQYAATRDLEAVVTAFDVALGSVLKDLIEWTLRTLPRTGANGGLAPARS